MLEVTNFRLEDHRLAADDPEVAAALAELYQEAAGKQLFPLKQQRLSFEIKGAPAAVANGLMRVMTQELPGIHLLCPPGVLKTSSTEKYLVEEFVVSRIENIPLRAGLLAEDWEDVELRLEKGNPTAQPISVYAGDFSFYRGGKQFTPSQPWFNPTHQVGFLYPGKTVELEGIRVAENTGRIFAGSATAIRGAQEPLDLEQLPRERTHRGQQGDAQRSGFVLSSQVACPMHHRVSVTVQGVPASGPSPARQLPLRAAHNVLRRLRAVRGVVERGGQAQLQEEGESSFWSVGRVEGGGESAGGGEFTEGVLNLRGETDTVAQLLRWVLVQKVVPDVGMAGVSKRADTNAIEICVRHRCAPEDLTARMGQTVTQAIDMFTELAGQLSKL